MKLASIDLGSNTLKYTLADVSDEGHLEVLEEGAEITRVGQDLDKNGYLLDEAMARTFEALRRVTSSARAGGAERLTCVATAGMRGADNAEVFLSRARRELDLEIEIIDGMREAELAFRAPSATYPDLPLIVFDVGGRSTELIVGRAGDIEGRVSLEMGAVRLTERFLTRDPPTAGELEDLQEHTREALGSAPPSPGHARMVGVSGTIVSLAGVDMGATEIAAVLPHVEGYALRRGAIQTIFEQLRVKPASERRRGSVIPEGRADVIVAGIAITLSTMAHYGADELIVSNRGVRYGLLFEMAAASSGGATAPSGAS